MSLENYVVVDETQDFDLSLRCEVCPGSARVVAVKTIADSDLDLPLCVHHGKRFLQGLIDQGFIVSYYKLDTEKD